MIVPPSYFEPIRRKAAERWEQLERDPDLAAPWHQLFKQVQSPRHIVSELLQNADDAGATEASVRIEDDAFVFEHDGEDFCEDHFASLCRFGYSNKRVLHTIGFRGIGFKSTFSLGDAVELYTPSLSVVFHRKRFTEPYWSNSTLSVNGLTRVRVAISDENRRREVEKNLDEWLKSPTSLLFFKHIRRLKIGELDLQWQAEGNGPVSDSEWMHLAGHEEERFLIIRSGLKSFPEEAVLEIAQERMLDGAESADFPPCKVEIVLGASGRLYVVLPTGVETSLPFACNAPFIQDPARLKIKDPETSPTNRWLLERIGELAASVMLEWLGQPSLSLAERSEAYRVMPDVDRDDSSIEGVCATIAEEAFDDAIQNENYVLTQPGKLVGKGKSVVIPPKLFDVWPEDKVSEYFDAESRPPLSRCIAETDCSKLLNWRAVEKIDRNHCLEVLQSSCLSQPETRKQLLTLWEFVAPGMIRFFGDNPEAKRLRIVPVHGRDVLYAATDVIRLGEKRLLQSEEDWEMLSANLLVLNQNWPRFISECRRIAETDGDNELENRANVASKLLSAIGLEDTSDTSKVIEQVAASFFAKQSLLITDCVQLAQIACKLGASIGNSFRFVTRENNLRSVDEVVVYDPKFKLESLLPCAWCAAHTLHDAYSNAWNSCSSDEWQSWIESGRSKFASFVPITNRNGLFRRRDGSTFETMYGRDGIIAEMEKRGFSGTPDFRYRNNDFQIDDWDFDETFWEHWELLATDDKNIWGKVMQCVLEQPIAFWDKAKSARALQIATTGTRASITSDPLLPSWIIKFRDLPCLPDTRGFYRNPSELLRRTPETESLLDVEPFIHGSIDNEAIRPLLDLLGVGTIPTGPDRLLDRLRALSKAEAPPVHEVEKWYVRLDQMADICSTDDFSTIKQALLDEKIVLTESVYWSEGSAVYLNADDDDVPVAALVRRSVVDLTLWRKIGIPDRPTADMAILWLNSLPHNISLPPEVVARVKALMHRHASRIWHECNCWLNLADELVSTESLRYSLSLRTLTQLDHLYKWVLQETADLRQLPLELADDKPFSNLPFLVSQLKEQFINDPIAIVHEDQKPWMKRFGTDLNRIELDSNDEQTRVRALGANLADSRWFELSELDVVHYIKGIPAGIPKNVDVIWSNRVVYVKSLAAARLACLVPDYLGKIFGRADVASALNYCFGRSPDEVTDYLEENFRLQKLDAPDDEPVSSQKSEVVVDSIKTALESLSVAEIDEKKHDEDLGNEATNIAPIEPQNVTQAVGSSSEENRQNRELEKPRQQPAPPKQGIVEKFMSAKGCHKAGENYFVNGSDGSSFSRSSKDAFSLVQNDQAGNVIYHYWVKDQCLETEPLQVDAVVWGMVEKFPETHGFLLSDRAGNPVEIQGETLKNMRENGHLRIFPATYRVVIES